MSISSPPIEPSSISHVSGSPSDGVYETRSRVCALRSPTCSERIQRFRLNITCHDCRKQIARAYVHTKKEPGAVNAVLATILRRDEGCEHLLIGPAKSAVGEERAFCEAYQRRVRRKTLQNTGHLRSPKGLANSGVELFTFGRSIYLANHRQVRGLDRRGIS
jgi:hypothetical protein